MKNNRSPLKTISLMASNRLISFAALFFSIFLINDFISHEPNITDLIHSISHLLPTNQYASPTVEDNSLYNTFIYNDVGKWIFANSAATIIISTATTVFASLSLALTRQWKPLLSSLVLAVVFPIIPLPPLTNSAAADLCLFGLALCHAFFTVYSSLKLITIPILESEERGKEARQAELIRVCGKLAFWQFFVAAMQFWMIYISKESYQMRVVVGFGVMMANVIRVVRFYELVAVLVLIYENRKAIEADVSSSESVGSKLLLDESFP